MSRRKSDVIMNELDEDQDTVEKINPKLHEWMQAITLEFKTLQIQNNELIKENKKLKEENKRIIDEVQNNLSQKINETVQEYEDKIEELKAIVNRDSIRTETTEIPNNKIKIPMPKYEGSVDERPMKFLNELDQYIDLRRLVRTGPYLLRAPQ